MRAMQLRRPAPVELRPLELVELPTPEPGPDEVRVRMHVCGACHTDLHTVRGEIPLPRLPIVPGHQAVGVVDALGVAVGERARLGERVGVPWLHATCGECPACRRGAENLCPEAQFTGLHVDGGYAEYLLARVDYLVRLPGAVPDAEVAPWLCAGIIGLRSLHQADVAPGERVGLFGFGASAHLAIQVARHWGCEVSVFTRSSEHRRHAEQLGAAWVGSAEERPPEPLDRAILFAPAGELVPLALEKLRPGGTLAINAIHASPIPELEYARLYGERTLRSVTHATRHDAAEFVRLAVEIPVRATVSVFPLAEANHVLGLLAAGRVTGEAVLEVARSG